MRTGALGLQKLDLFLGCFARTGRGGLSRAVNCPEAGRLPQDVVVYGGPPLAPNCAGGKMGTASIHALKGPGLVMRCRGPQCLCGLATGKRVAHKRSGQQVPDGHWRHPDV